MNVNFRAKKCRNQRHYSRYISYATGFSAMFLSSVLVIYSDVLSPVITKMGMGVKKWRFTNLQIWIMYAHQNERKLLEPTLYVFHLCLCTPVYVCSANVLQQCTQSAAISICVLSFLLFHSFGIV